MANIWSDSPSLRRPRGARGGGGVEGGRQLPTRRAGHSARRLGQGGPAPPKPQRTLDRLRVRARVCVCVRARLCTRPCVCVCVCVFVCGVCLPLQTPGFFRFCFCFLRGAVQGDECLNHLSLISRKFNPKEALLGSKL